MKIECYMSTGCGTEEPLRANVRAAVEMEGIDAKVIFRRITDEEAVSLALKGSPSVFINGVDIEPQEMAGFSWKMFTDESGRRVDVPSVEMLRRAIRRQLK